jgi:alginate O-acetyltransferase complex protein AlgI
MLFNSYSFLFIFLPIVLLGYYGCARHFGPGSAKIWLCAASLVFYGWWNPGLLVLLGASITFNYLLSTRLHGGDTVRSGRQSIILTAAITANVLLLFYYKYLYPMLGFFYQHGWIHFEPHSVILPIGISFFTFTQIGFLVDCRQGLVRERGFLNYLLFVSFFPHLIAGPVLHHREVMPQFADPKTYRLRAENIAVGLTLFAVGLAKKTLLADSIANWADLGYARTLQLDLVTSWSVALAYSMQLYFDFSGYSDMAIGLGIMFGIRMPLNFNSPYRSLSIIAFWQRWHMTLTRYVTLLVYNPLSLKVARHRQRAGLPVSREAAGTVSGFVGMIAFPTFVTTLIVGLWHGAGLQFAVYGALHGLYLCINHLWRVFRRPLIVASARQPTMWPAILWRGLLTYLAVVISQVFFHAHSVPDAWLMIKGLLGSYGSGFPLSPLVGPHLLAVAGLAAAAFALPNVYQILGEFSPALTPVQPLKLRFVAWRPSTANAMAYGALLGVAALWIDRTVRFLYFQF